MALSLRALVFVTLVCCLSTHGTLVETTRHWKPPPPLLASILSQCDIAHLYRNVVPAGHTNVTFVFSLGGGMDIEECILECCKVGPRQCQYALLFKDVCFAVACSPEESLKCVPVAAGHGVEVTYVEMSYAYGSNLAPVGLDHPPTAVIDPQVRWVSSSEAYLYGSHSSDDEGIASYHWNLVPYWRGITLEGTNTATLHVSGLMEGKYRVGLTVTDLAGQSNRADIDFTVSSDLYTADTFHDLANELLLGGEDSPSHTPSQEASTEPSSTATSVSPTLTQSDRTGDPALEDTSEIRTSSSEQSNELEETSQSGRTNGSDLAKETIQTGQANDSELANETSQSSPAEHELSDGSQSGPTDYNELPSQFTETSHSSQTGHDQPVQPDTSGQSNVVSPANSGSSSKSKPNLFVVVAFPVLVLVGLVLVASAVVVTIPACCMFKREAKRVRRKYRRVPVGETDA